MADVQTRVLVELEKLGEFKDLLLAEVDKKDEVVDAKSIKYVSIKDNVINFYKTLPVTEESAADFEIELPETDLSNYLQKFTAATAGDIVTVATDGKTISDSGVKIADVETLLGAESVTGSVKQQVKVVADALADEKDATKAGSLAKGIADNASAIETLNGTGAGSVAKAIADAIDGLDAEDSVVAGQFVTSVSEEDGVITVSRAALTADDIPELTLAKISDAGTVASKDVSATEIASEDAVEGSIPTLAQVKKYVADEVKDLEGATHFIGVKDVLPETANDGDICIVGVKEYIYVKEDGWKELGDETIYVSKSTTIAGVDLQDDITKTELLNALNVEDGSQVNIIESVKVNGTALSVTDKAVDVTIVESANNGKITVNGTDVAIHGLGSMAYEDADDFDEAGAAAAVQGDTTATVKDVEDKIDALTYATSEQIAALFATE